MIAVLSISVNSPPITTLLSDWRSNARTVSLAPVLVSKLLSTEPFGFRRAIYWRVSPSTSVKLPPMSNLPSDWTITAYTAVEGASGNTPVPGSKLVSDEPSEFKRVILLWAVPLNSVKFPPTIIFPSGWTVTAFTTSFAPVPISKLVSNEPSAFKRAR